MYLFLILIILILIISINLQLRHSNKLFEEKIKLTLIDESENEIKKIIKRSEFIIENAHNIGRELENQFNKSNNTILEPYNISRIIGLVDRAIKINEKPNMN